jgi:hypothetical protein
MVKGTHAAEFPHRQEVLKLMAKWNLKTIKANRHLHVDFLLVHEWAHRR